MYTVQYVKLDESTGEILCGTDFNAAEEHWERLVDSGECRRVQIFDNGNLYDWWDLGDDPLDFTDEDDYTEDDEDEDDEDYSEWDDEDWEDEDSQSYHEHEDYFDEIGYDPYQGCVGDDC